MPTQIIASLVRHALTLAAGGLLAQGTVSGGDIEIAAGAVAALATIGWSIVQKLRAGRAQ